MAPMTPRRTTGVQSKPPSCSTLWRASRSWASCDLAPEEALTPLPPYLPIVKFELELRCLYDPEVVVRMYAIERRP